MAEWGKFLLSGRAMPKYLIKKYCVLHCSSLKVESYTPFCHTSFTVYNYVDVHDLPVNHNVMYTGYTPRSNTEVLQY